MTEKSNGAGRPTDFKGVLHPKDWGLPGVPSPPVTIVDLSKACVDYVERAVGVALDFEVETLSILDHYLTHHARETTGETQRLVVAASTAYLGEVVRRRFKSWWRPRSAAESDPNRWVIDFVDVELSFTPSLAIGDAIRGSSENPLSAFELPEADRSAAARRLDELPAVSEEEFVAVATRVEVLDIVYDAAKQGLKEEYRDAGLSLTPDDYED